MSTAQREVMMQDVNPSNPQVTAQQQRAKSAGKPALFFLAASGAILLLKWLLLPTCYGALFLHVWVTFVLMLPFGFLPKLKPAYKVAGSRFLVMSGAAFLFLMSYFHIEGLGFLMFSIGWIFGWLGQEKHSAWIKRAFGVCVGLIFCLVSSVILLGQLADVSELFELRNLDGADIAKIELERVADGQVRTIESRSEIGRFAAGLGKTYVYLPNHEGISDSDPWQVRIHLSDSPAQTLDFLLGNGNSSNPGAAWIQLGTNANYQSPRLGDVLSKDLGPGLWSSGSDAGTPDLD